MTHLWWTEKRHWNKKSKDMKPPHIGKSILLRVVAVNNLKIISSAISEAQNWSHLVEVYQHSERKADIRCERARKTEHKISTHTHTASVLTSILSPNTIMLHKKSISYKNKFILFSFLLWGVWREPHCRKCSICSLGAGRKCWISWKLKFVDDSRVILAKNKSE